MIWLKKNWWIAGLLLAVVLALLSPLASPHPDGLERVAEDQGFIAQAKDPPFRLIADYLFPGIQDERLATIVAGLVGIALVFGLVYGLSRALSRKQPKGDTADERIGGSGG
jgi:hypothetical protein